MNFERTRRPMKEINLTALIDIVFHLMVFVMLTTSFVVSESMELSLPSGKVASPTPVTGMMRVAVISDGSVVVDERVMSIDRLSDTLVARVAADPEVRIALYTTSGASVQQLITVMDAVYLAGGHNVQVEKAG